MNMRNPNRWSRLLAIALMGLTWPAALAAQQAQLDYRQLDTDPLRQFVPSPMLFQPVPAGLLAVKSEAAEDDSFEDRRDQRHGGMIMGYCFKFACSYVSHIVVEQVCANQIGGAGKSQRLVLGVIKMPYGKRPGYLRALRGRNYAENYARYGPFEQILTDESDASLGIDARGMGPVAPLEFDGNLPKAEQSPQTITFQLERSGWLRKFEVRHLCQSPLS